jgi:hypothetical protein
VLHEDGLLVYFREVDSIDPEDPWSLVNEEGDSTVEETVNRLSSALATSLTPKSLELRGEMRLTEKTVCQGHFYSKTKHELSIK